MSNIITCVDRGDLFNEAKQNLPSDTESSCVVARPSDWLVRGATDVEGLVLRVLDPPEQEGSSRLEQDQLVAGGYKRENYNHEYQRRL